MLRLRQDQPLSGVLPQRILLCRINLQKTAVLLGSSSSIAANKAVKETLEGILDDGPAFEECFEFENSSNSIQSVKGRLKAHFSFWVHALGANDFILRV